MRSYLPTCVLVAVLSGCGASGGSGPGWGPGGSGSGSGGGSSSGGTASSSGSSGSGGGSSSGSSGGSSGGSSSGGSGSGGSSGGSTVDAKFKCADANGNSYTTADELCQYVVDSRQIYGTDWSTAVKNCGCTWPETFTVDASLNNSAQAEAQRLASGGAPVGQKIEGTFYEAIPSNAHYWKPGDPDPNMCNCCLDPNYESATLMLEGQDTPAQPGDMQAGARCTLDADNTDFRTNLLHYNPPWGGPVATKIGCGAQTSPDGNSVWRVVQMGP